MKTPLALALLAVLSGSALATDFATITFVTGDGAGGSPAIGQSFSQVGDSYIASFTSFTVIQGSPVDAQWTHSFDGSVAKPDSPAREAFGSVTQVVTGRVSRTAGAGAGTVSFSAILSESVTNSAGLPFGSASQFFDVSNTAAAGQEIPFTLVLTVPFTSPLQSGFSIKDDLVFNAAAGTTVRVDSIAQNYAPVPEPATLAALGLGAAALLRRRRSR